MQPKLLMTPLGQYAPAKWLGVNESGITPVGDRVLILPDSAAESTSGGVYITEEQQERMTAAAETGILVAVGPDAWLWNSDRTRKYEGEKPKVGQRVIFERYAGSFNHAADGRRYRLMDDKCVAGLFEMAEAAKPSPLTKVVKAPLVVAR